ncbi:phosphoglycerate mutase [Dulcicalothrix desertica PCC 7102]|uniref:Phosphoglycerate mutase n=1 Tax=Dulcicalothrix desertica PCC 7102 TaxID=232991 RepID=A0A3S5K3B2_9CYAN|nr:histidine phosphatase family protein [Dulcicalothrix desertica]RUT06139.1 phosphoglycerate mutase [Dulcicalothrix desertica PCC 7102]TWH54201.1 broad specificity phosphatase PhoE [Dulcicalothrix desertica PCC 7102]
MSQIIWIARHANRLDFVNPDWFLTAERRYDPPLSEDGFIQAQQLANRLKGEKIHHIFVSPFLRTVQTAHAIADVLNLPIKLETGLSEWLNPDWMDEEPQLHPVRELVKFYPRIDASYTPIIAARYPETRAQVRARAGQAARCLATEHSPENILLVAHGASVNGAVMGIAGESIYQAEKVRLCSLFKLVRQYPEWWIELKGDTSHLTEVEEMVRFN